MKTEASLWVIDVETEDWESEFDYITTGDASADDISGSGCNTGVWREVVHWTAVVSSGLQITDSLCQDAASHVTQQWRSFINGLLSDYKLIIIWGTSHPVSWTSYQPCCYYYAIRLPATFPGRVAAAELTLTSLTRWHHSAINHSTFDCQWSYVRLCIMDLITQPAADEQTDINVEGRIETIWHIFQRRRGTVCKSARTNDVSFFALH